MTNWEQTNMNTRRTIVTGLGATLGLSALGRSAIAAEAKPSPRAPRFANVEVLTHDGRAVRFYDDLIRGKLVVINMMYARCEGICPKSTANLLQVQRALGERVGRDIFMYSLTLTPEHDTPEVLSEYVEERGIGPGWVFLTGRATDLELLRRQLGFFDQNPSVDSDRSQHTGMVRIGNEPYDRWHMTPALGDPEPIVESILHADRSGLRGTTAERAGLLTLG
jgi:protein SCO1/2